ncbi:MAG: hypothetical protein A3C47_01135 [Omnitrophica bacterium RIFCSPHIGHO2_02_FULL_51_18]|nr:MAG: hypothetical protein A3C47_01135 [Omnitrophica bacterium RIFCSPHIGHO2_02_FULL_51_18]
MNQRLCSIEVFVDACVLHCNTPESECFLEILDWHKQERIRLWVACSVEEEIDHPHTPLLVKKLGLSIPFYTREMRLNTQEMKVLERIKEILAGNGCPVKVERDARHIFEARKYSAPFITLDKGILKKAIELKTVCHVHIFNPCEYKRQKSDVGFTGSKSKGLVLEN